ncbi:hypothetical protein LYSBPC_28230 [Lysinibacillus piscis]|uniref:Transposon Tn7 transposition protein TnsD C-terminal domain-containing protein n=1 Tax=Lysinibacillus piscis TaxID=2518931 RepID=A0ABQ5NMU6_9BACI|nr:hypothetical protein LYSBPC_28230 [Lysinibacillus sp. KH24]
MLYGTEINEGYYYLFRFKKVFINFQNVWTTVLNLEENIGYSKLINQFDSLLQRLNFICRAIDKLSFEALKNANNDTQDNILYHFGKVHQQYFTQQFKHYYGEEFLTLMDCNSDEHSGTSWLRSIVRKHRKAFHPVQHLLLLQFLNVSFKDLGNFIGKKYEPFGQAPYYCLNPAADHYKQRIISNVTITTCTDTRKPVGTFSCECKFVYSRCGPDEDKADSFKVGRIKNFGSVWQAKLMQLATSELSPYCIVQVLDCDYATVQKYMSNLKGKSSNKVELPMDLRIQKEAEWLKLIETYSDFTVTQLREINSALYAWHYRNNLSWLTENPPRMKEKITVNN